MVSEVIGDMDPLRVDVRFEGPVQTHFGVTAEQPHYCCPKDCWLA
jgi:hypothetical protein